MMTEKLTPVHARGLTLLEVLIALVVLSVGLIGVAVLTMQSLQSVHSSLHTSLASAAALDFEERLWLEVGSSDGGTGCPNSAAIESDFLDQWGADGTLKLGLPSLRFSEGGVTSSEFTRVGDGTRQQWMRLGLILVWDESRFGGSDESFRYFASVPCRG